MKLIRTLGTFETAESSRLDVNTGVCTMDMWVCLDGGGGADRGITRVSLSIRAHACIELKRTSASALVPSAGLTSWKNPTPVPSEGRF